MQHLQPVFRSGQFTLLQQPRRALYRARASTCGQVHTPQPLDTLGAILQPQPR